MSALVICCTSENKPLNSEQHVVDLHIGKETVKLKVNCILNLGI